MAGRTARQQGSELAGQQAGGCAAVLAACLCACLFCAAAIAGAQASSGAAQPAKALADPRFDVATVRPSNPSDENNWMLGTSGNHFYARDTTLIDLISFAYGLHAKQIMGGPEWMRTQQFDIEGVPNYEGHPKREQLQVMLRKLLAARFQLRVHTEKQEMAAYVLVVASGGAKMRKSDAPADAHSGYHIPDIAPVTRLRAIHLTMPAFASALQRTVLDRPVVDETGLTDRYDFELKWTPDESQFIQFRGTGVVVPPTNAEANAPPGLFTAIQDQLALKLEAKKAAVDVVVVDHVEEPSANRYEPHVSQGAPDTVSADAAILTLTFPSSC